MTYDIFGRYEYAREGNIKNDGNIDLEISSQ